MCPDGLQHRNIASSANPMIQKCSWSGITSRALLHCNASFSQALHSIIALLNFLHVACLNSSKKGECIAKLFPAILSWYLSSNASIMAFLMPPSLLGLLLNADWERSIAVPPFARKHVKIKKPSSLAKMLIMIVNDWQSMLGHLSCFIKCASGRCACSA